MSVFKPGNPSAGTVNGITAVSGNERPVREFDGEYITGVLFSALEQYFNIVRSRRKFRNAVKKTAGLIASDLNWIKMKTYYMDLLKDGVLESFFNKTTTALMIDSTMNPRPVYRINSREKCYAHWVEACNPLTIADGYETALSESFAVIYRKFDNFKTFFNVNEVKVIFNEAEKQISWLRISDNRPFGDLFADNRASAGRDASELATLPGISFIEYVRKLADEQITPGSDRDMDVLPFTGRADEILELKKFCFTGKQFMWWAVTGKSGSGKSRLAYELCNSVLRERKSWYCVSLPESFYNITGKFNGNWALDRHLLAIVDSANFNIEKIGVWMRQIIESDSAEWKIRILLLERETGYPQTHGNLTPMAPPWLNKLIGAMGENILANLCYKRGLTFMKLDMPGFQDCLYMLEDYASDLYYDEASKIELSNAIETQNNNINAKSPLEAPATDKELAGIRAARQLILGFWREIDPGHSRPLVLTMLLSAIDAGVGLSGCSGLSRFLDALYEYELERAASISGAESRDDPKFAAVMLSLAYAAVISAMESPAICASDICAVMGYGAQSAEALLIAENVSKICETPSIASSSIFSGYFVIRALNFFGRAHRYNRSVVNLAWARRPFRTANFLYRAIEDFYHEYDLPELNNGLAALLVEPARVRSEIKDYRTAVRSDAKNAGEGLEATVMYSELLVYMSAGRYADAREKAAAGLSKLHGGVFGQNSLIAHRLSQARFNLALTQDAAGLTETAVELAELREQGFSGDKEITLRLFKLYFNIYINQDKQGRKETVELMEGLRNGGFEQDRDITLILAQSLFILTAKQDEDGVKNTIARLEDLRGQGFEQDAGITLELVKALLNLTTKQDETGRKETAARIDAIRNQGFMRDRGITLELTKALLNLTLKQDKAGMEDTVRQIEKLRDSEFISDKDMARVYAQALLNLTTKQDGDETANTVNKLEALRGQGFETDRDIALELATALFNLSTRQDEAGIRKTVERLEEMRNLGFTRDRDITLRLAQTLFSLTTRQGAAGRKEAAARIDELRGLGYEQDREMTLTLIKSLYNLTIEQDSEGAKETVARIEEIINKGYGQDKEINLLYAKSLFNLTTKLDEGGIADAVSRLENLRG